jgi:hypothetical protein
MPRDITDVLHFRGDLSPFLVHLTRRTEMHSATDVLGQILQTSELRQSQTQVSDARFAFRTFDIQEAERPRFLSAICLTETPLSEIHCLLNIERRTVNLEPYGLVLLKDRLKQRGVGPVYYVNNYKDDKRALLRTLGELWRTAPEIAEQLVPMIALCGNRVTPPGAQAQVGVVDFIWEREWRLPFCYGNLGFTNDDVFCGLCPDAEIETFEALLPGVGFIDPQKNMTWYATKLIAARQRLNLKTSVV